MRFAFRLPGTGAAPNRWVTLQSEHAIQKNKLASSMRGIFGLPGVINDPNRSAMSDGID